MLEVWRSHVKHLINELFNSFICGNLISVSAMTRGLIECYAYISIIKRERSKEILDEWLFSGLIGKVKRYDGKQKEKLIHYIRNLCKAKGYVYEEIYDRYKNARSENVWLSGTIKEGRVSFRDICDYLDEDIYADFQQASDFVHGQDIASKFMPFTFYESIYSKLAIMMIYIFRTIRLYPIPSELDKEMETLEAELVQLESALF